MKRGVATAALAALMMAEPGRNKGGPFSAGSIFTAKYARWPLSSAKMAEDRWDFFVFHVHERNWYVGTGRSFLLSRSSPFFPPAKLEKAPFRRKN